MDPMAIRNYLAAQNGGGIQGALQAMRAQLAGQVGGGMMPEVNQAQAQPQPPRRPSKPYQDQRQDMLKGPPEVNSISVPGGGDAGPAWYQGPQVPITDVLGGGRPMQLGARGGPIAAPGGGLQGSPPLINMPVDPGFEMVPGTNIPRALYDGPLPPGGGPAGTPQLSAPLQGPNPGFDVMPWETPTAGKPSGPLGARPPGSPGPGTIPGLPGSGGKPTPMAPTEPLPTTLGAPQPAPMPQPGAQKPVGAAAATRPPEPAQAAPGATKPAVNAGGFAIAGQGGGQDAASRVNNARGFIRQQVRRARSSVR